MAAIRSKAVVSLLALTGFFLQQAVVALSKGKGALTDPLLATTDAEQSSEPPCNYSKKSLRQRCSTKAKRVLGLVAVGGAFAVGGAVAVGGTGALGVNTSANNITSSDLRVPFEDVPHPLLLSSVADRSTSSSSSLSSSSPFLSSIGEGVKSPNLRGTRGRDVVSGVQPAKLWGLPSVPLPSVNISDAENKVKEAARKGMNVVEGGEEIRSGLIEIITSLGVNSGSARVTDSKKMIHGANEMIEGLSQIGDAVPTVAAIKADVESIRDGAADISKAKDTSPENPRARRKLEECGLQKVIVGVWHLYQAPAIGVGVTSVFEAAEKEFQIGLVDYLKKFANERLERAVGAGAVCEDAGGVPVSQPTDIPFHINSTRRGLEQDSSSFLFPDPPASVGGVELFGLPSLPSSWSDVTNKAKDVTKKAKEDAKKAKEYATSEAKNHVNVTAVKEDGMMNAGHAIVAQVNATAQEAYDNAMEIKHGVDNIESGLDEVSSASQGNDTKKMEDGQRKLVKGVQQIVEGVPTLRHADDAILDIKVGAQEIQKASRTQDPRRRSDLEEEGLRNVFCGVWKLYKFLAAPGSSNVVDIAERQLKSQLKAELMGRLKEKVAQQLGYTPDDLALGCQ